METTIRYLFSDQARRFKIPAYQRSYAWQEKHILQFVEDLQDAQDGYYLGHFLFEEDAREGADTLLVIDGQQRLTTCVIFFSTLYRTLTKRRGHGETVSVDLEDIQHNYLRDLLKKVQKFRTVDDDNNFFEKEIIDREPDSAPEPNTASQKLIRAARVTFEKCFKNEKTAELERWYQLILKANCTEYRVHDKIAAARIFAFQNDRGQKPSALEVLKAFFVLQIYLHSPSPEAMTENLKFLETEVSAIYRQIVRVDADEDDVLLYCWRASSHSRGFDSENAVVEIKEWVTSEPKEDISGRVKDFMRDLAETFRLVEKIEQSHSPAVRDLIYLDNMALAYPFFIRARLSGAADGELERLAKALENTVFRVILIGGRARITARLNHVLRAEAGPGYADTAAATLIHHLRHEPYWSYWSDQAMVNALDEGAFYYNRIRNYVLWRYELFLYSQDRYPVNPKLRYEDLIKREQIEHIAPQTPTNGDPVANGYGAYEDATHPDKGIVSGEWLNCVGNLVLIAGSHNVSIGNAPFEHKLATYGNGNLLAQQKEIIEFVKDRAAPVWDVEAIGNRQHKILAAAKVIWSLDGIK